MRESVESLERAFLLCFEKVIAYGEIPATVDPRVLTMMLVANHLLNVRRARAGYSPAE